MENGKRRITRAVGRRAPVEEYLRLQARFRHVVADPATLAEVQRGVDERHPELPARRVRT